MGISWEQFDRDQEQAAIGAWVKMVEDALKARNGGRNQNCWPLVSFGWKDADLDPAGCCGIKAITGWRETDDGEEFRVKVGGHKATGDPADFASEGDDEESIGEIAHAIVCDITSGYDGNWDGDGWSFSFEEEIAVARPWMDDKTDEENAADAAERIIQAAEKACDPFGATMTELSDALDRLIEDIDAGRYREPSQED